MSLEEAIETFERKSPNAERNHDRQQIVKWLRELKQYRDANAQWKKKRADFMKCLYENCDKLEKIIPYPVDEGTMLLIDKMTTETRNRMMRDVEKNWEKV